MNRNVLKFFFCIEYKFQSALEKNTMEGEFTMIRRALPL